MLYEVITDVEHPGCIAETQHVPRQFVPAEDVGGLVLLGAFPEDQSDHDGRCQVEQDDQDVKGCEFHRVLV